MSNNNLLKLKYFLVFVYFASVINIIGTYLTQSIVLFIFNIIIIIGSMIFSEIIIVHSFKTEKELVKLFDLIDNDKYDEAEDLLKKMQAEHGGMVPELAKAEAMLNFLNPNQR